MVRVAYFISEYAPSCGPPFAKLDSRLMMWRPYLVLVVLSLSAGLPTSGQTSGPSRVAGSISIRSEAGELIVSPADAMKLPRQDQRLVPEGGGEAATVSGVRLWDLLQLAGAPPSTASGRQRAVIYVKLTGADGQSAVVALVEVDPSFSKRTVIVADRRNGRLLDSAEGPWRVFIPDDMRHARWIRGLVAIEVVAMK